VPVEAYILGLKRFTVSKSDGNFTEVSHLVNLALGVAHQSTVTKHPSISNYYTSWEKLLCMTGKQSLDLGRGMMPKTRPQKEITYARATGTGHVICRLTVLSKTAS
jgi:hypothetical protein